MAPKENTNQSSTYRLLFSFSTALFFSLFFGNFPIFYFVPPALLALYVCSLSQALVWTLIAGLCVDLMSPGTRLGFHASLYLVSFIAIFPLKKYFFLEKWTTLPLLSFLFSILLTFLHAFMIESSFMTWPWGITNFLFMPLIDALYAFSCFTLAHFFLFRSNQREHLSSRRPHR